MVRHGEGIFILKAKTHKFLMDEKKKKQVNKKYEKAEAVVRRRKRLVRGTARLLHCV